MSTPKSNGHGPRRAIDRAIERTQPAKPAEEEVVLDLPPGVQLLTIPFAERPVKMAPTGKLRLDTPADPAQPMLLVLDADAGLWKAILLPPDVRWVLQAEAAPKPGLWTPGSPK